MARSLPDNARKLLQRMQVDAAYRELVLTSGRSLLIRLAGVFTGFMATWMTARYFSAEALGVVSICIGILSVASMFAKAGHDIALMRFISAYFNEGRWDAVKGVYRASAKSVLPVSLVITVLLYASSGWMAAHVFHQPQLTSILQWNSLLLTPLTFLQINSECIRGVQRIGEYTFLQTAAISTFAWVGLVIAHFSGLTGYVPVYLQFLAIFTAAAFSMYRWNVVSRPEVLPSNEHVSIRELKTTAGPMFTTTIMQLLMSWSGQLILAANQPAAVVGIFNALVRVSVFTNITILAVNGLMMTRFATAFHAGNSGLLRHHSREATRLIFLTSLPLFAALFCFPDMILSVFGPEFKGYTTELVVLVAGQLVVVCVGLPGQLLNMTNRQSILRNVAIVAAIVNVGSGLLLIPVYGMVGACFAQVFGTLVWNGLCVWAARRQFGFFTFIGFSGE